MPAAVHSAAGPAVQGVGVGLLGLGVVGSGVATALLQKGASIETHVGAPVVLRRVLVRDAAKPRDAQVPANLLTTHAADVLEDPAVAVVIELLGGDEPACSYIRRALQAGKHVVTANKEVIARHGPELAALASKHHVALRYEASVGGGIPLIAPFRQSLLANTISSVRAIINGTTNYILTRMSREGLDLPEALASAQKLGYAEPNPTNDVEGIDAGFKLAILASLAFHTRVAPEQVFREGILNLTARDFRYAHELGYAIKLLAIARRQGDQVEVRVHPAFLPQDRLLAKVDGVYNAVEVEGDLTGQVVFYGRGAGAQPTTSAVVADLIELARDVTTGAASRQPAAQSLPLLVMPMDAVRTRYYLRMSVRDEPGVLAHLAGVLGDCQISIASVVQKEVDEEARTAELVLMTHLASEHAMQAALAALRNLSGVAEIGSVVRVEN